MVFKYQADIYDSALIRNIFQAEYFCQYTGNYWKWLKYERLVEYPIPKGSTSILKNPPPSISKDQSPQPRARKGVGKTQVMKRLEGIKYIEIKTSVVAMDVVQAFTPQQCPHPHAPYHANTQQISAFFSFRYLAGWCLSFIRTKPWKGASVSFLCLAV